MDTISFETIQKTLSDIATARLAENAKGFYTIDFLLPSAEKPQVQAEAGLRIAEMLKISLWGQYDISGKTVSGGIRIGGDFSL